jgi:hypothetical protein
VPCGRAALARLVPAWTAHNELVSSGRFPDGIRYVLIAAWDSDKAGRLAPVHDVIRSGGPPLPARRVLFAVTSAAAIVRPVARQSTKYVTTPAQSHLEEVAQTSRRM